MQKIKFKEIIRFIQSKKLKKTMMAIGMLLGSILVLFSIVLTIFLFTGRIFFEIFGWLFFPFPKRMLKFRIGKKAPNKNKPDSDVSDESPGRAL